MPLPSSIALSASSRWPSSWEELAKACRFGRLQDAGFPDSRVRSSGFEALDRALPIGGWPVGALTEIMPRTDGIGELRLVTPLLAKLTQERRYIAFVEAPHLPYPPALAQQGIKLDRTVFVTNTTAASSPASPPASQTSSQALSLWAAEQMLRCAAFGAVLVWCATIGDKELRRLQLAAEAGKNIAFIYRPPSAALSHSPAALRLCLHAAERALHIEIKKCRGGYAGGVVHCALAAESGADDTPSGKVA